MTLAVTCPSCQAALRVRDEYGGKPMKCPRCEAMVNIPPTATVVVESQDDPFATAETQPCPHCRKPIPAKARKCRYCRRWLDEDEEEEAPVATDAYRPCPRCGAAGASRVMFTFWGSFYGPALFTHVRCPQCHYAYNGRTGGSNRLPAVVFVAIPLILILAILGGLGWLIWWFGR